ncbi:hypothetical protein PHLGIDRAFT_445485 [Phlebiopsis gigantea 11061_1 CR5-6]|uniref:Uncharacterized protein n=1 Tax=Phlebiopsis gigantea (strain 11061_1 CR5-6) TaxID=745531 RepID=A0A0C3RXV6_PHLG1|nr:hypothetical protein PHLGIDRAFT_445485 [Phlebiopsis gigantea 11061_1 CR5-6]
MQGLLRTCHGLTMGKDGPRSEADTAATFLSLKVPDDAESDRVWHYAKRVRYWTVDDLRLFDYQIRSNEAFTGLASPFLFPYLQQLYVKEVTSRTISPTLLMPPSLQNVQLQWVYPEDLSILPFAQEDQAIQSWRTHLLIPYFDCGCSKWIGGLI